MLICKAFPVRVPSLQEVAYLSLVQEGYPPLTSTRIIIDSAISVLDLYTCSRCLSWIFRRQNLERICSRCYLQSEVPEYLENDIDLLITQTNVPYEVAKGAYYKHHGDIVDAIMWLTTSHPQYITDPYMVR